MEKRHILQKAVLAALLLLPNWAFAEQMEIVTYYPAPGTTDEERDRIHASRVTIGDPFSMIDPVTLPDGTLLVGDRIGVGIDAPAGPLHVIGRDDTVESVVFVAGANTGDPGIPQIQVGIGAAAPVGPLHVVGFNDADSPILFLPGADTGAAGAPTVLMGIGTADPEGILHVVGADDIADFALFMPGADTAAAGTPAFRVGIGTSTPDATLDIEGNAGTEKIRLTSGDQADSVGIYSGANSPEGVVTAQLGSLFMDHANGGFYVKQTGDDTNTGWVVGAQAGGGTGACPGGFISIEIAGRTAGCLQENEADYNNNGTRNEAGDRARWEPAAQYCFSTFGGRLPFQTEWYLGMANYTLLNESEDSEWNSDGIYYVGTGDDEDETSGVISHASAGPAITTHIARGDTLLVAFRCWVDAE